MKDINNLGFLEVDIALIFCHPQAWEGKLSGRKSLGRPGFKGF